MNIEELLQPNGPVACVIAAEFEPVAGDRFQPAGFPELGHVIYKAPRQGSTGDYHMENVCIVDSAASMANHLEEVCLAGPFDQSRLHSDLDGLAYVQCVTDKQRNEPSKEDPLDLVVCTSLTEGHRLASDYFLNAHVNAEWSGSKSSGKKSEAPGWRGRPFREKLREEFELVEITKDKKYFAYPQTWWKIFQTIFGYDPNSLVHGVLFAKEQIKISRLLAASFEAFGAERVPSSGVKFDRLGKTTSGQPIFSVDQEVAREIRATFVIDLALLRSYGRGGSGLDDAQKRLLLELAIWKIQRLTEGPFRFRSGCFLECKGVTFRVKEQGFKELPKSDIKGAINNCNFKNVVTKVYYPSADLFKVGEESEQLGAASVPEESQGEGE